ncbi:MAG: hypothetical protein ACI94D_002676, partial [Neolewinella sp.]
ESWGLTFSTCRSMLGYLDRILASGPQPIKSKPTS